MSWVSAALKRDVGAQKYEEMKAGLYGSALGSALTYLPQDAGAAPKATLQHDIKLDWQPIAAGAAIFLATFYLFFRKG